MNTPSPFLSVVVPAFNESGRIREPLQRIDAYLGAQEYSSELIVVDDGSTDATCALVRETAAGLATPVRVVRYAANRGKGFALKVGFREARGEIVLFTDADLSTPIETTADLLAAFEPGCDCVIGSRKMAQAVIEVRQPWFRESLGRVFTFLVRNLVVGGVSDVTCGFKAFRGEVGRDLFSRVRVYDWSFDAEILFLARRLGHRIAEVPVRWEDREGTKVSLLRDSLRSLLGLARIRTNALLGRYRVATDPDQASEVFVVDMGVTREPSASPAR